VIERVVFLYYLLIRELNQDKKLNEN